MITKPTGILMAGLLLLISSCHVPSPSQPGMRSASGVLTHFPPNVRTPQAWYGHNFVVDGIPVQPTSAVPESRLLECVGKRVSITGLWNPGYVWKATEEEKDMQIPVRPDRDGPIVRGDGIRAQRLTILE